MDNRLIEGVSLADLQVIPNLKGDIYHAFKRSDKSYEGFGESYFSWIKPNEIKGWKLHNEMTLNLVVPLGNVKFVICSVQSSKKESKFFEIIIGDSNYQRLTIKPNLYFAFQGFDQKSLIMNIASIEHDENESINKPLDFLDYKWT